MDAILDQYWPQLLGLIAFVAWLIRLEAGHKALASVVAELRREQGEINRRAQDQAVTLAAINESLSSIKRTLDRLYERVDRAA